LATILKPVSAVPALTQWADPMVGNVARTYARMAADLRQGTRTAPSFDDAVALHEVIAAIETAASDGKPLDVGRASA
jgi:hypothetical protein